MLFHVTHESVNIDESACRATLLVDGLARRVIMTRPWEADPSVGFRRRLGKTAAELGDSKLDDDCPDIWELENGDIAVIGRDHTADYAHRLPRGVSIGPDERLVIVPRNMVVAAKPDIPNA
jgi:hypothetical protein